VVPLFVFDDALLATCADHANRLGFLLDSFADLDKSLRDRGGALVVRRGRWAETVAGVAREAGATDIHLSADVSRFAVRRAGRLERAADEIHEPDAGARRACGYPEPLVDHREAVAAYRQRLP
jgi:deoxyribodipyrimidine photo-lyase